MRTLLCGVAVVVAFACNAPSRAQNSADSPELDALFQEVLRDPSNRELNLRYVALALQLNDYEAAISALDRLLFIEPENPTYLLQIADAYLAVKSYPAARGFYDQVAALPGASAEQKQIAVDRLAEIERQTRPSPWDLYAQAGFRYQTNASAGPSDLDGVDPAGEAQEDWNGFVLGVLSYTQPVGNGAIEAALTTYYADQFEINRLDLGAAEVVAGPRLPIATGETASLSLKPYGLAGGVLLGDDPYLGTYGGGVAARARLGAPLTVEPYFEYRDRTYFNSDDYPNADEQTGELFTYAMLGNGALGENVSWFGRGGFKDNDAREDHESYDEYFVDMSVRVLIQGDEGAAWALTPSASAEWTDYQGIDPSVGGTTEREDFEWRAGARLDIPVHQALGLGIQVQYLRNNSNIPRFDYDNLQVTLGPTVRF